MIPSEDWFRITDEEVAKIPEMSMFLNTLGFCNAVAQVHSLALFLIAMALVLC